MGEIGMTNQLLARINTKELMMMLMEVPTDILADILLRLPSSSLCRIRRISKILRNISVYPSFVALYTSRLLNSAAEYAAAVEAPQLMLLTKYSNRISDFNPFTGDYKAYGLTTLQSLKYSKYSLTRIRPCNARIFSSFGGYGCGCPVEFVYCNLIFIGLRGPRPYKCYLVNPLGGEALELPVIPDEVSTDHKKWFGMGFNNTTSTHKIVCVSESGPNRESLVAYMYTLGGTTWRQIQSAPPYKLSSMNVSAYGHMHWLTDDSLRPRIISFDFKKEEFFLTPNPKLEHDDVYATCLLNFKGCLALVSSQLFAVELWVLKDYENNEWELECQIDKKRFSRRTTRNGHAAVQRSFDTCGEWEHGLFFMSTFYHPFHVWDARDNSLKYLQHDTLLQTLFPNKLSSDRRLWDKETGGPNLSIFSYIQTPISLKNYANLVQRAVSDSAETCTWYFD